MIDPGGQSLKWASIWLETEFRFVLRKKKTMQITEISFCEFFWSLKSNLNLNHTFPIDWTRNENSFGTKSTECNCNPNFVQFNMIEEVIFYVNITCEIDQESEIQFWACNAKDNKRKSILYEIPPNTRRNRILILVL